MERKTIEERLGGEPIDFLVSRPAAPGDDGRSRRRRVTPHERERRGRKLTVTLPDGAWVDAIAAEAERWGVRKSDVLIYAFAHLMAAFEGGEERPQGCAEFWQRAGEGLELPWGPE